MAAPNHTLDKQDLQLPRDSSMPISPSILPAAPTNAPSTGAKGIEPASSIKVEDARGRIEY